MSDLRACPFCGGEGRLYISIIKEFSKNKEFLVGCSCTKCGASCGRGLGTDRDGISSAAVAAWNRREPDYERKWGELVETVSARTDQAKGHQ